MLSIPPHRPPGTKPAAFTPTNPSNSQHHLPPLTHTLQSPYLLPPLHHILPSLFPQAWPPPPPPRQHSLQYSQPHLDNLDNSNPLLAYIMPERYGELLFKVAPQAPNLVPHTGLSKNASQAVKRKIGRSSSDSPRKRTKTGPTRLRKGREVKTNVPQDVWDVILQYSEPKVLFQMKSVSKTFATMLSYEGLWRKCRVNHFGEDLPSPPAGLKEYQYLDLLDSQGCMACGHKAARKTYWAFLRRWCEKCFQERTVKRNAAQAITGKYDDLLDCIMHATIDSWGSYEYAGDGSDKTRRLSHGDQHIYLRSDIIRILLDHDKFLALADAEKWSDEQRAEERVKWMDEKKSSKAALLEDLHKIEGCLRQQSQNKQATNKDCRKQREDYFVSKAAEMDPPLNKAALELIPAYQKAIKIMKPANRRSWSYLLPKLHTERSKAEEIIRNQNQPVDTDKYHSIYIERRSYICDDQRFVLRLADRVIKELEMRHDYKTMHDQDFILYGLKRVWEVYQQIPMHRRPKSLIHDGRHQLTLEDAYMVHDKCLCPALDQRNGTIRRTSSVFKCPGCKRLDVNKRFCPKSLFVHLRDKHASEVGDFDCFRQAGPFNYSYYWFAVKWPRNLPILAEHHQVDGTWDPNDPSPYRFRAPDVPSSGQSRISAFEGRSATEFLAGTPKGQEDFVGNIRDAAALFRHTQLPSQFTSKIALQYALERLHRHNSSLANATISGAAPPHPIQLDKSVLQDLAVDLLRTGEHNLFNKLCCKACAETNRRKLYKHYGNTPRSFAELIAHFDKEQRLNPHSHRSWTTDLFALPSGEQLTEALERPGMEAARTAFYRLFPLKPLVTPWRGGAESGGGNGDNGFSGHYMPVPQSHRPLNF